MISFDFIDVVNILNTLFASFGFHSTKSLMILAVFVNLFKYSNLRCEL